MVKLTRSRNLLVRVETKVDRDFKDMKVVLEDLSFIGVVSDVIGPVREPYVLVKVVIPLDRAKELEGKKVYLADRREDLRLIRYSD